MPNYLDIGERKKILDEILNSEENLRRKEESLMNYEIYKNRQYPFVLQKIASEMSQASALKSRVISSINLTEKIINEQARIYQREPERFFAECSEDQEEHALELYKFGKANNKFKKLNRVFKLSKQCALQVVPKDGMIEFRPLYPHHYDVVPMSTDPEKAECYIISSFDKSRLMSSLPRGKGKEYLNPSYFADTINQAIGDPDDYKGKQCFYWWTDEYNFITNKDGDYVDKEGNILTQVNESDLLNPIGKLPFVDVAMDKDFEFFVRSGNGVTQFSLDLALLLSDTSEVNRLQGFAQAVISSKEEPKDLRIGPRNYLWLRLDPNDAENARPSFQFTSPNPDLASSLQLINNYASMFLTSIGQNPTLINASGQSEKYNSGFDRFLAMIDKFEQSQEDVDLFKWVEMQAYELVKLWNNVYYNVTENGFVPELSGTQLPEDSYLQIKYAGPEMTMSETEKLTVLRDKLEMGLISRVDAIMSDRGVDRDKALDILKEVDNPSAEDIVNGQTE